MSVKCPKCGSDNTRNSKGNKFLKGVGEFTANFIPINYDGVQNVIGRFIGGTLGLLWHKRVCNPCGHTWWHEIDLDNYDD